MRIAHIVTYYSSDAAFGGPVRVALNQAEGLAARGHDVTVFAASPPQETGRRFERGYTLRTFKGTRLVPSESFAPMVAPSLQRAITQDVPAADIYHVHLARDLVSARAAAAIRGAGAPYVVQTHGMVRSDRRHAVRVFDRMFAFERNLDAARAVLVLTRQESDEMRSLAPRANVVQIQNGLPPKELPPYSGRGNLVLFLARLQARKRPLEFVAMAKRLASMFPDMEFVLAGPDGGEADRVVEAIASSPYYGRIRWIGPIPPGETDDLMQSAKAYVLPAVDEVFPMTILEAIRAGTPVVTTTSLGIADACREYGAALLTDGSVDQLTSAVRRVLEEPILAENLREGGQNLLRERMSMGPVLDRLESVYSIPDARVD